MVTHLSLPDAPGPSALPAWVRPEAQGRGRRHFPAETPLRPCLSLAGAQVRFSLRSALEAEEATS